MAKALAGLLGTDGEVRQRLRRRAGRAGGRRACSPASVLLLENLRFHAAEEENDPAFAKQLAALADIYVNDAFGTAHRAHASHPRHHQAPAPGGGRLPDEEGARLPGRRRSATRRGRSWPSSAARRCRRRSTSSRTCCPRVDKLLLGGGMTYTFLKAQGLEVGKSIVENDKVELARSLLAEAGDKLVLPDDFVVTDKLDFKGRTVGPAQGGRRKDQIPADWEAVDIGPASIAKFEKILLAGQDHRLERPGGRVRDRRHRQGHHRRGRGAGQGHRRRRHHHHRRRRLGLGRQEGRRGQQGLARVDRRRRLAGVPGGQGAARGRGPQLAGDAHDPHPAAVSSAGGLDRWSRRPGPAPGLPPPASPPRVPRSSSAFSPTASAIARWTRRSRRCPSWGWPPASCGRGTWSRA